MEKNNLYKKSESDTELFGLLKDFENKKQNQAKEVSLGETSKERLRKAGYI